MNFKGSLPLLILFCLSQGPSHGYQLAKAIKQESQGVLDFKEGTLYPTLHSMAKQGVIEAYDQEENGRTRRCYRLTEQGRQALNEELARWERYSGAINRVLRGSISS